MRTLILLALILAGVLLIAENIESIGELLGTQSTVSYDAVKQQASLVAQAVEMETYAKEKYQSYVDTLPEDMSLWSEYMRTQESSLNELFTETQKDTNKAIELYNKYASKLSLDALKDLPDKLIPQR